MNTDYLLSNLSFYALDIGITLMQVNREAERLHLGENLTAEQSKALRRQMGATDEALHLLRDSKRLWQALQRNLDRLSPWLYNQVRPGCYDWSNAMTNELIAVLALYLKQTDNDNEATISTIRHLVDIKPLDAETADFVRAWLSKAGELRKVIFSRLKEQENGKQSK